jgi:hypothetical protein
MNPWWRLLRVVILSASAVVFWLTWKSGNYAGQIISVLVAFCAVVLPGKRRREYRRFPRRFRGRS